ncbi:MAG: hypothetical protein QG580_8 [Patescibacteria group bacterium]|jgi:hypothetical protein|nr:hypothetical protein [Patescibacteria group bacterium]
MLYFLVIFAAYAHYVRWMFIKLSKLHKKVREAKKIYTIIHESDFNSTIKSIAQEPDFHLGLYRNRVEFKDLQKRREVYYRAFCELREFQRTLLSYKETDMFPNEFDSEEIADMKLKYISGISKRGFFSYYPEYLKSTFRLQKPKTKPR